MVRNVLWLLQVTCIWWAGRHIYWVSLRVKRNQEVGLLRMEGNQLFRRTRCNFNLKSHWQLDSQRACNFVLPIWNMFLVPQLWFFFSVWKSSIISYLHHWNLYPLFVSISVLPCVITAHIRELPSFIYLVITTECLPQSRHCTRYTLCVNVY